MVSGYTTSSMRAITSYNNLIKLHPLEYFTNLTRVPLLFQIWNTFMVLPYLTTLGNSQNYENSKT